MKTTAEIVAEQRRQVEVHLDSPDVELVRTFRPVPDRWGWSAHAELVQWARAERWALGHAQHLDPMALGPIPDGYVVYRLPKWRTLGTLDRRRLWGLVLWWAPGPDLARAEARVYLRRDARPALYGSSPTEAPIRPAIALRSEPEPQPSLFGARS